MYGKSSSSKYMYRRRPQRIYEVRTNTPDTIRCIWISGHPWTEVSTTFHMSYMSYVPIIKCLLSFSSVNFFLFTSIRLTYVHKEQTEDIQPSSMSATTIPTESFWEKQQHTHSTKMFDFTTIANRLKTVSRSYLSHHSIPDVGNLLTSPSLTLPYLTV